MIPKIIHYCWFGKKPLSEYSQRYIKSWCKMCPDYEIKRWDEDNFDITCIDYVKEAYECKKWAFVSDYARLWIIYHNGGIYLDTDVELISNFDNLLKYDAFFGFEGKEYINTGLGFGAMKGNLILANMMHVYENSHFLINGKMNTTSCPHINTNVFSEFGLQKNGMAQILEGCIILPSEYMCPYDYISKKKNITANTISIHHYKATWMTNNERELFEQQNTYINKYGKNFGKFLFFVKSTGVKATIELIIKKMREKYEE